VTFNNNPGSTKSYDYVREHVEITGTMDFAPMMKEITTSYEAGSVNDLIMHDGTTIRLHKLAKDWDPFDRISAANALQRAKQTGEILTGLLYIDEHSNDLHEMLATSEQPLNQLGKDILCPGSHALSKLNSSLR
jgi:2-oxoglutarate ferredoxin oxidoreductase subunit beta